MNEILKMKENGELTLDEAIEHIETDALPDHCGGNEKCYMQHLQLWDWLKELKKRRESDACALRVEEIGEAEYLKFGGYFANGAEFDRETDNLLAFKEYESAESAKGRYYRIVR